ncbi:MAG TPA: fructosamine kinase family protein [Steroidobacteraceae bacterium]|nr:fructosamine kinase family protein [Steroidobacteraceae bacterium]
MSGRYAALAAAIAGATGRPVAPRPAYAVGAGTFGETWCWRTGAGRLFVKAAPLSAAARLVSEAAGLAELTAAAAVRVPAVAGTGTTDTAAWLALEWLDLEPADSAVEAVLGEQLAALHCRRAAAFGFAHDNYIGGTPQTNAWLDDWAEFVARRRLAPQLALADRNGYGGRLQERGSRLVELTGVFYSSHRPVPSLLHGDLWAGNWGVLVGGTPVIFDPAAYFGDREADVAMTRLFGGFGARFYDAYQAAWPLDQGASVRRDLHNLYHVLNHLNLFGASYLGQALAMIDRLLAEAGR